MGKQGVTKILPRLCLPLSNLSPFASVVEGQCLPFPDLVASPST